MTVQPAWTQRPADRGCGVAGDLQVVEPAQHSVAWERRTGRRKKPRDVPALLVDCDDRVQDFRP